MIRQQPVQKILTFYWLRALAKKTTQKKSIHWVKLHILKLQLLEQSFVKNGTHGNKPFATFIQQYHRKKGETNGRKNTFVSTNMERTTHIQFKQRHIETNKSQAQFAKQKPLLFFVFFLKALSSFFTFFSSHMLILLESRSLPFPARVLPGRAGRSWRPGCKLRSPGRSNISGWSFGVEISGLM